MKTLLFDELGTAGQTEAARGKNLWLGQPRHTGI